MSLVTASKPKYEKVPLLELLLSEALRGEISKFLSIDDCMLTPEWEIMRSAGNFLNQQESGNALNEYERLKGMLSTRRDPSLNDGSALRTRMSYLQKRMTELKSKPIAGPEGLYLC